MHPRFRVRMALRCLCDLGRVLGRSMLETTARGEDPVPAGPWAASARAAQCQGLGAAVGTTAPAAPPAL